MVSGAAIHDHVDVEHSSGLSEEDLVVIRDVDRALADGLKLKAWWQQKEADNSYAEQFELVRTFNKASRVTAFFDTAPLDGKDLRVMGLVQEMLFDQPKHAAPEKVRDEFREFILHYFMRVSSFRQPEVFIREGALRQQDVRPLLRPLSWCPPTEDSKAGFGYFQIYYKLRESGLVGKFPAHLEPRIVDLREIGDKYEWIVVKSRIFNFNLTFSPFGPEVFSLYLPQKEDTFLAISRDFVTNQDDPNDDLLGKYGLGYALLKPAPEKTIFAYGPGHFSAGFQLIDFEVRNDGQTRARLVFVANRPDHVLALDVSPVDWSFRLADLMTFGFTSRFFGPVKNVFERFSPRLTNFDPVTLYISLVNLLSAGMADERLCVSLETLEKNPMLVTHFMEHYELIVGALITWRHVQDWLDRAHIPEGIIEGTTS